jgi:hypothetical protein
MKKQLFTYEIVRKERNKDDFLNLKNYDSIKKIKVTTVHKTDINNDNFESTRFFTLYVNRLEYVADILSYDDTLRIIVNDQPEFLKINWI